MENIITLTLGIHGVIGWYDWSKNKVSIAVPLIWNIAQVVWIFKIFFYCA